jgi:hypothetical protein
MNLTFDYVIEYSHLAYSKPILRLRYAFEMLNAASA